MGVINSVVFRPPRPPAYTEYSLHPKLFFKTTRLGVKIPIAVNFQGTLRKKTFHDEPKRKWLLFAHGNAEDLQNATIWTTYISEVTSLIVVSYDYSGYGLSCPDPGSGGHSRTDLSSENGGESQILPAPPLLSPSEDLFLADAETALAFAEEELGLRRENAILWGRSLGCSAVCHLVAFSRATDRPFCGIILQAPFTSAIETIAMTHLDSAPTFDLFRNFDKVKAVGGFHCPTFVVHGMDDWIINWWHGREMATLIPEAFLWPPLFPPNVGHNDLESGCDRFLLEIEEFIHFCVWRLED